MGAALPSPSLHTPVGFRHPMHCATDACDSMFGITLEDVALVAHQGQQQIGIQARRLTICGPSTGRRLRHRWTTAIFSPHALCLESRLSRKLHRHRWAIRPSSELRSRNQIRGRGESRAPRDTESQTLVIQAARDRKAPPSSVCVVVCALCTEKSGGCERRGNQDPVWVVNTSRSSRWPAAGPSM